MCVYATVYYYYYDIDIHVRPPTLLILAARKNRVNDIPIRSYTYINTQVRWWWCVYSCIIITHEYYIFIYVRAETRYPFGTSFFARGNARTLHTHARTHMCVYMYKPFPKPYTPRLHCICTVLYSVVYNKNNRREYIVLLLLYYCYNNNIVLQCVWSAVRILGRTADRRRQEAVAPNTSLSLHLFNDGAPWTPLVHRWPFFFFFTNGVGDRPSDRPAASGRTDGRNS